MVTRRLTNPRSGDGAGVLNNMKNIVQFHLALVVCLALGLVHTARATPLFDASFDTSINADAAVGDATASNGYGGDAGYALTSGGLSRIGPESLNCNGAGRFAYSTVSNINWTTGTVDFFIQPDLPAPPSQSWRYALNIGGTGGLEYRIGHHELWSSPLTYLYWNGVALGNFYATWFTEGEFSHMAITWDMTGGAGNGIVKIYADGELQQTYTSLDPAAPTHDHMWLGSHYITGGGQIDGYIDDFVVYDELVYDASIYTVRDRTLVTTGISGVHITATAPGQFESSDPGDTVNDSGMKNELHTKETFGEYTYDSFWNTPTMWLANEETGSAHPNTQTGPCWIKFEFDKVYNIQSMWVWNYNEPAHTDDGLRNVTIEYTVDGQNWTRLGSYEFDEAPGLDDYTHDNAGADGNEINFGGIDANCIVITAHTTNGNWGSSRNVYGLSEIKFFGMRPYAENPNPAVNEAFVSDNVILGWSPGEIAVSHNVYFGTNATDVLNGTGGTYKGNQSPSSYAPTGLLALGQTYYWRIDEVDASNTYTGDVWSFAVFDDASLPDWGKNGYGLWIENSMKRVFPASRPDSYPAAPSVSLSLARREYESFQTVILPAPGQTLSNIWVETSDLVNVSDGSQIIAAENIKWFMVGYVWMENTAMPGKEAFIDPAAADGWWPDLLLPATRFDVIDPDRAQPIWVTVYAPVGTAAGQYTGTITVTTDDGLPTEVDMTVTVYDFTLAKGPGHCKTAFRVPEYSWRHIGLNQQMYPQVADFMLKHRLNPDDLYRGTPPAVSDLEHYYEEGMNSFAILNTQDRMGERPMSVSQAFIDSFLSELAFSEYADELRDMAFLYVADELGEREWERMRGRNIIFEELYPDIERMAVAYINYEWGSRDPIESQTYYGVDWSCPYISEYNFDDGETVRAAGNQLWNYIIGQPKAGSQYLSIRANGPLVESRVMWWQMYHQKMDGYMTWSLTAYWKDQMPPLYRYNPVDPANGPLTDWTYMPYYGIANVLCPGVDGPIATLRLDNFRDGIEDYEYLWMLAEKAGDIEVARTICESVSWALHERPSVTHDADIVQATRDLIASYLISPKANLPNPADAATGIAPSGTLRWGSSAAASSHNVYFDANAADVASGTIGTYKGNQVSNTYDYNNLKLETTYYWRIDEVTPTGIIAGDVWSFTADSGIAKNPDPADLSVDMDVDLNLGWASGYFAVSHDVYFGTNQTDVANGTGGTFRGNQAANVYDPGMLSEAHTYYWRIDEIASAITTGEVWSFTIHNGKAMNPNPADGSDYTPVDATLGWTGGLWAESHDVYLDTIYTDVLNGTGGTFKGNQTSDVYVPSSLVEGQTYYWRIDEVNDADRYTGDVWSFTAMAPWSSQDVGSCAVSGSLSIDTNDLYTVQGSGTIWNNVPDAFNFSYQTLSGDGMITARLLSLEGGSVHWARGGVMIRESLSETSKFAMMSVAKNLNIGRDFVWRTATGTALEDLFGGQARWIRIERTGNTLRAYSSHHGIRWAQFGDDITIDMTENVYIGLVVTSSDSSTLTTAKFDNVYIGSQYIPSMPEEPHGTTFRFTQNTLLCTGDHNVK